MNPFSLNGGTAPIAGGSRGIGLAKDKLDVLARVLDGRAVELDVNSADSIRHAAAEAGDVDILVNVAGANVRRRFEAFGDEDYEHVMHTNLHGIVRLTQIVGARMIERGKGGKISSIGSLLTRVGLPYMSVYSIQRSHPAEWMVDSPPPPNGPSIRVM